MPRRRKRDKEGGREGGRKGKDENVPAALHS
jgi:hypothetical protein